MRYAPQTLSAQREQVDGHGAEPQSSTLRQGLRGLNYEEASRSLSPDTHALRLTSSNTAIQMSSQTSTPSSGNNWAGRLTTEQELSATRYNKSRRFRVTTIKRYQSAVRTLDDGSFGPNTAEAIARFQEEHGLAVDGKIGPNTQAAIEEGMSKVAPPEQTTEEHNSDAATETEGLTSGQLSSNFSLSEFASKDGAPTPQSVLPALRDLAEQLEVLKAALGGVAIHITSGYRSPSHNRRVGGASRSQHLYGRACDIVVSGYSPWRVAAKIEELIRAGKMKQGGVGRYNTFVHYDTRGSAARW